MIEHLLLDHPNIDSDMSNIFIHAQVVFGQYKVHKRRLCNLELRQVCNCYVPFVVVALVLQHNFAVSLILFSFLPPSPQEKDRGTLALSKSSVNNVIGELTNADYLNDITESVVSLNSLVR